MVKLSCTTCRMYLPAFVNGKLGWRVKRQVMIHLRQCDRCLHLAERQATIQAPIKQTARHTARRSLPGKGQAVVKWAAVFFGLMMVISLLCFTYDIVMHEQRETATRAWIELRYPHAKLGTKEIDWTGWFPYYRHASHYPLLRRDHTGEHRRLGTVIVSESLWWHKVDVRMNQPEKWPALSIPISEERTEQVDSDEGGATERAADGDVPGGERGDGKEDIDAAAWTALEQLPASVKVDIAFSTRHLLTPRAMAGMLKRYNLPLLSMYVYGGESREEAEQVPPLQLVLWTPQSGTNELEVSEQSLRDNLLTVVQHPIKADEQSMWRQRLDYVQENGVQTYGVTMRGTPRELLRLREVLELQEPVILAIDWVYTSP